MVQTSQRFQSLKHLHVLTWAVHVNSTRGWLRTSDQISRIAVLDMRFFRRDLGVLEYQSGLEATALQVTFRFHSSDSDGARSKPHAPDRSRVGRTNPNVRNCIGMLTSVVVTTLDINSLPTDEAYQGGTSVAGKLTACFKNRRASDG